MIEPNGAFWKLEQADVRIEARKDSCPIGLGEVEIFQGRDDSIEIHENDIESLIVVLTAAKAYIRENK